MIGVWTALLGIGLLNSFVFIHFYRIEEALLQLGSRFLAAGVPFRPGYVYAGNLAKHLKRWLVSALGVQGPAGFDLVFQFPLGQLGRDSGELAQFGDQKPSHLLSVRGVWHPCSAHILAPIVVQFGAPQKRSHEKHRQDLHWRPRVIPHEGHEADSDAVFP